MTSKKEIVKRLERLELQAEVTPKVWNVAVHYAAIGSEPACARFLQHCISQGVVTLVKRKGK